MAFTTPCNNTAATLYVSAINDLEHIKYYYVEAHLFYARFLQKSGDAKRYEPVCQRGITLAKKHYYRFLIYQFEDLQQAKNTPYNSKDYPLPDGIDFDDYIQFLIKDNKKA